MKTSILIGAHVYATIATNDGTRCMDVLIPPGNSVSFRLTEHVTELRDKAARLLRDAEFIESAIPLFARQPCNS